jgi:hypothetical protein
MQNSVYRVRTYAHLVARTPALHQTQCGASVALDLFREALIPLRSHTLGHLHAARAKP